MKTIDFYFSVLVQYYAASFYRWMNGLKQPFLHRWITLSIFNLDVSLSQSLIVLWYFRSNNIYLDFNLYLFTGPFRVVKSFNSSFAPAISVDVDVITSLILLERLLLTGDYELEQRSIEILSKLFWKWWRGESHSRHKLWTILQQQEWKAAFMPLNYCCYFTYLEELEN